MENSTSHNTFYNRVKETKQIIDCINSSNKSINNIILIGGKTGVGKSGLIRKILQDDLRDQVSIVITVSKVSPNTIENLHYINAIYRRMSELAEEHFFDTVPSPFQQSVLNLKNLARFVFGVIWTKYVGDENQLYEPTEESSVIRKKNYIIDLLKRRHYLLDIENIQNVDTQSLEILQDIVLRLTGITLILEYTIDETHTTVHFSSLYNELKSRIFNANVSAFSIDMLKFDEAKKLAPPGIPETRLETIYKQGEGNLVNIILSENTLKSNDSPIQVELLSLSNNEKFLVNLIYLNGGTISFSVMCRATIGNRNAPPLSPSLLDSIVNQLVDRHIVQKENEDSIKIFHDSILSELEVQSANPILFSAFDVLKTFYFGELRTDQDEYTIKQLFRLCTKFSDPEIIKLFPYIKRLVKKYKYPQDIVKKLTQLRNEMTKNSIANYTVVREVSLFLTTLCLELGFAEEAQQNLNIVYVNNNPYHRALQASIYALNFTSDASMKEVEKLANQALSARERLTIQLCQLSAEMARLSVKESAAIAKQILETKEFQSLFEYAFLLRDYAELVPEYDESIALCQEALRRFKEGGRVDLCAQVQMSMSMFYAYKGQLKIAKKLLLEAKKVACIPDCYLLNNLAVIDLLSHRHTNMTAKNLWDALLVCNDAYEKIIIMCNLLVCYIEMGNRKQADELKVMIEKEEYSQFQYEEFLHIVYQDLYYYCTSFGQLEQSKQLKALLCELVERTSGTMAHRIGKLQLKKIRSPKEFFSNFPFRVDFLGSWSVEISRDLEHCQ